MDTETSKITWMMVLCGAIGAASTGAVSAATTGDDVPSIAVRYDPMALATDDGARTVYRRLMKAAEMVCPDTIGSRLVSNVVAECREQAVARAVHEINNPHLAALHGTGSKPG